MNHAHPHRFTCQVCGKEKSKSHIVPAGFVREAIGAEIRKDHPEWGPDGYICLEDLNRYRAEYVSHLLEDERGEMTHLEDMVVKSLHDEAILSRNVNDQFDRQRTIGERLSDRLAEFGGSWTFILSFGFILVVWITINSIAALSRPFDPYPYILLNLVLSCLAAMQAPIIMMSQNRQEEKDRLRAENDYRINLKAELEIRQLHAKIDQLVAHQWQRLLEIQQVQMDMLGASQSNNQRRSDG